MNGERNAMKSERTEWRSIRSWKAALGLGAAVVLLLSTSFFQRLPAGTPSLEQQVDLALVSCLNSILTNKACPLDLDQAQALAAFTFPMMYPYLAMQVTPQDPAIVEAESGAIDSFLNPWQYEANLMQDPAAKAAREADAAALPVIRP
jgi:hypothetical protein